MKTRASLKPKKQSVQPQSSSTPSSSSPLSSSSLLLNDEDKKDLEVELILESRETNSGQTEYKVKWKGKGLSQSSWMPREYFQSRAKFLIDFETNEASRSCTGDTSIFDYDNISPESSPKKTKKRKPRKRVIRSSDAPTRKSAVPVKKKKNAESSAAVVVLEDDPISKQDTCSHDDLVDKENSQPKNTNIEEQEEVEKVQTSETNLLVQRQTEKDNNNLIDAQTDSVKEKDIEEKVPSKRDSDTGKEESSEVFEYDSMDEILGERKKKILASESEPTLDDSDSTNYESEVDKPVSPVPQQKQTLSSEPEALSPAAKSKPMKRKRLFMDHHSDTKRVTRSSIKK